MKEILKFFLPIFIILNDVEESPIGFFSLEHLLIHDKRNRFFTFVSFLVFKIFLVWPGPLKDQAN